jgi:predicted nucleotidyltransferase
MKAQLIEPICPFDGNIYIIVPVMGTIMKSKENKLLWLFFENPAKEWHFEEIVKTAKIARSKADAWLKKFINEGLVRKIKEKGKMPYYNCDPNSPAYQNKKRIFAMNYLYETNFLNHLVSLKKAKTVIVFGSFTRWDWYAHSDIDLFVYGDSEGLNLPRYQSKLHREIQLFECKNKEEVGKLGEGLIANIIKGDIIKGDINFATVSASA